MSDLDELFFAAQKRDEEMKRAMNSFAATLAPKLYAKFVERAKYEKETKTMRLDFYLTEMSHTDVRSYGSGGDQAVSEFWKSPESQSILFGEFLKLRKNDVPKWKMLKNYAMLTLVYDAMAFVNRGCWAVLRARVLRDVPDDVLCSVVKFVTRMQ